jgi:hypothetical protein
MCTTCTTLGLDDSRGDSPALVDSGFPKAQMTGNGRWPGGTRSIAWDLPHGDLPLAKFDHRPGGRSLMERDRSAAAAVAGT